MAKRTYTLKLCSATTTTANAAASVSVPRSGRVVAIDAELAVLGGAGVDARMVLELSRQSVSTVGSNDTAELALSHVSVAVPIANSGASSRVSSSGLSAPVEAGARLYINQLAYGTALAHLIGIFLVHIEEN